MSKTFFKKGTKLIAACLVLTEEQQKQLLAERNILKAELLKSKAIDSVDRTTYYKIHLRINVDDVDEELEYRLHNLSVQSLENEKKTWK